MKWHNLLIPLTVVIAGLPLSVAAPAGAASRVSVANDSGNAAIDSKSSTTLKVSGAGFQSVKNGHGGVYVFFGTVSGGWQPSKGGTSGSDYVYVPDGEEKNNQGFQRYVAFPGSDTAPSANGGSMSESGSWSTSVVVPGPVFEAYGRDNQTRTVDCRKETCGIITVGAHGVSSAPNETFTPVSVEDLHAADTDDTSSPGAPDVTTVPSDAATSAPNSSGVQSRKGRPKLEVDRSSAVSGRVLSFSVSGFPAGQQFSVIFDDGKAAAGPFQVGSEGRTTGVITLPAEVASGTHELRIFGIPKPPSVKFAVRVEEARSVAATSDATAGSAMTDRWGLAFAAVAGAVLLIALLRVFLMARGRRRAS